MSFDYVGWRARIARHPTLLRTNGKDECGALITESPRSLRQSRGWFSIGLYSRVVPVGSLGGR